MKEFAIRLIFESWEIVGVLRVKLSNGRGKRKSENEMREVKYGYWQVCVCENGKVKNERSNC